MQMHGGKLHPVRFCGLVLKENEVRYHPAERKVLSLLQLLKITRMLLSEKIMHAYTHFLKMEWLFTSKALPKRTRSLLCSTAFPVSLEDQESK